MDPLHRGWRQRLAVPIAPLSQIGEEAPQIYWAKFRQQDLAQSGDQVDPRMIGVTLPRALANGLEDGQPVAQPLRYGARCTHCAGGVGGGEFTGSVHGVLCAVEAAPPRPLSTSVRAQYLDREVPRTVIFFGQVGAGPVLI
ncbi:hypothetical protein ACIBH1_37790 [Nonomuraea sp. NPDC050663]|uniref:hypothetical protein n=1 Tax=Nonomuraea sp. NPDC050663 TaxID=3364370 RepID=UPI00379247A1